MEGRSWGGFGPCLGTHAGNATHVIAIGRKNPRLFQDMLVSRQ
jgi:hypothetical protein